MMRATYPDVSAGTIANNTGQVWNFINTIALGDLVVVPLRASRSYRIGRVVGPAGRREKLSELAAVRPVEWEAKEVAAQVLGKDLRHALGSIMTVFRPGARAAERRLETVMVEGRDPGPDSGGDDRSGAWVFQSNPKRFDLLQALDAGSAESWSINQHQQDIQPGDRVWFRITGPAAGVYAIGRVTSLPRKESNEFGDWRADVTFESRVNPPLSRAESNADPILVDGVCAGRADGHQPGPVRRGGRPMGGTDRAAPRPHCGDRATSALAGAQAEPRRRAHRRACRTRSARASAGPAAVTV